MFWKNQRTSNPHMFLLKGLHICKRPLCQLARRLRAANTPSGQNSLAPRPPTNPSNDLMHMDVLLQSYGGCPSCCLPTSESTKRNNGHAASIMHVCSVSTISSSHHTSSHTNTCCHDFQGPKPYSDVWCILLFYVFLQHHHHHTFCAIDIAMLMAITSTSVIY